MPAIAGAARGLLIADVNGDQRDDMVVTSARGDLFVGVSVGFHFKFSTTSPSTFFFIAPWDLDAVRENPLAIRSVFRRYLPGLRKRMSVLAPTMSDEMFALVFTTIFSYENASYRAVGDPLPNPKVFQLRSLLAAPKLVCTEYCYFAHHLYRLIYPKQRVDALEILIVGWDHGIFGNHSQIIVRDRDQSWLLDPTVGIIARTDLASLLDGMPVASSAIVDFSRRSETSPYLEGVMTRFREKIRQALTSGAYPLSDFLYELNIDSVLRYRPAH